MIGWIAKALATLAAAAGGSLAVAAVGAQPFSLHSTTFAPGSPLPRSTAYDRGGCGGTNRSPELHWSGAPPGTRSFALVMHDPDAPVAGGWYHWLLYDIPASVTRLPEGLVKPPGRSGRNSWGESAYGGPCPPPGPAHRYVFTLYALDVERLPFTGSPPDGRTLEAALRGHVLGEARLVGLYRR